jgi:PAS domain S-box-containing protein
MNDPLPALRHLGSRRGDARSSQAVSASLAGGHAMGSLGNLEAALAINQRLFETSNDLIVIVDQRGDILRVSPSAEAILGYRPAELVGESAIKLLHPEDLDNTRNEMRLARRGRTRRNFDCRYVHKDGTVVTLS